MKVFRRIYCTDSGFTLVELVVVIVIVGILAALGGKFIVAPVTGYVDLARRTRLVDQADSVLQQMQRDIRHALPNSIRVDATGHFLEMLNTVDGGRYRRYPDPAIGGDSLDFTVADDGFDLLGQLSRIPTVGDSLVVYNISSTGTSGNAYDSASSNRATIGAASSLTHINLTPPFYFAEPSPFQRFFIVDQPVTYACEGGVLNRYQAMASPPGNRQLWLDQLLLRVTFPGVISVMILAPAARGVGNLKSVFD